jgi:carbon-monoxide dehydrogenase medium subunit
VIPAPFEYVRARSVDEALEALSDPEAKTLAGGQSLLPLMKLRLARPSVVVDIGELDLAGVEERADEIHLGALTTWDQLTRADTLRRPELAALGDCARGIGDLQVRNRGTLGGGLAHADPAADMPAVALALGARVCLRSPAGEREVAASDFFTGPFMTVLGRQELLMEMIVPTPPHGSGSAYVTVEHPASGFALAGAAALALADGRESVALTGVAGHPFLLDGPLEEAESMADTYVSAAYRRALAEVVARRALDRARKRAKEQR